MQTLVVSPWLVGGVWSLSMVAPFLNAAPGAVVEATFATSVIDPLAPAVMVPSFQVILPPEWVPPPVAETNDNPDGRVSVMIALVTW